MHIRNIDTLPLDGGILCFHFINTVHAWRGINLHEYLNTYQDVIHWCKKVNLFDSYRRANLLKEAALHPVKTKLALQQLKDARELLYRFFSAMAAHAEESLPGEILQSFNTLLSNSLRHLAFTVKQKRVKLEWRNAEKDLLAPLWVVMKSAYDIITMEDHSRIKECPRCGWIFIDNTKNNKRRWCNPSFCGSTDKSKKYYQKIKRQRIDISRKKK